eukprot:scaffold18964_cov24-Tisochrysis_lutea.AAC.1
MVIGFRVAASACRAEVLATASCPAVDTMPGRTWPVEGSARTASPSSQHRRGRAAMRLARWLGSLVSGLRARESVCSAGSHSSARTSVRFSIRLSASRRTSSARRLSRPRVSRMRLDARERWVRLVSVSSPSIAAMRLWLRSRRVSELSGSRFSMRSIWLCESRNTVRAPRLPQTSPTSSELIRRIGIERGEGGGDIERGALPSVRERGRGRGESCRREGSSRRARAGVCLPPQVCLPPHTPTLPLPCRCGRGSGRGEKTREGGKKGGARFGGKIKYRVGERPLYEVDFTLELIAMFFILLAGIPSH